MKKISPAMFQSPLPSVPVSVDEYPDSRGGKLRGPWSGKSGLGRLLRGYTRVFSLWHPAAISYGTGANRSW